MKHKENEMRTQKFKTNSNKGIFRPYGLIKDGEDSEKTDINMTLSWQRIFQLGLQASNCGQSGQSGRVR